MKSGTIIKSTGSWYQVRLDEDGTVVRCRIIGKFRTEGQGFTNPVTVGDKVGVLLSEDEEVVGGIQKIEPRTNYVVRQSPRRKHDMHLLASNIDQAILLVTIVQPNLKQGFIDRFLLMTEPFNIPVKLVFNKADLYGEEEMAIYEYLQGIYTEIGHETLLVSAQTNEGIDRLRSLLQGKTSLVSGQSGVGKSSLASRLQPELDLRTNELSDYSGKGQHTTTFAEMYTLDMGGFIIDTPGIKTLSFNYLSPKDVAHNFREFFVLSENCRFGADCLHRNEPGCAVKEALQEGKVNELRYTSYLTILEEIDEQNYWERRKV